MERHFSKAALLALLATGFMTSCIDYDYDLRGGVSKDISLPNNKLTIPLGDLKPFRLDSLLKGGGDLLRVEDGVYGIHLSDTVTPIALPVELDPLHIDPIVHDATFEVTDFKLEDVQMPGINQTLTLNLGQLTKDDINQSLPVLKENAVFQVEDDVLQPFKTLLQMSGVNQIEINDFDVTIQTDEKQIFCDFNCVLPEQVKSVNRISFCERDGSLHGKAGARVAIDLVPPAKASALTKTIDMDVVFPPSYELALDDEVQGASAYSIEKGEWGNPNVLHVRGLDCTGQTKNTVSLYAVAISGLERYLQTVGDECRIDFHDKITYRLSYRMSGALTLSVDDTAADFGVQLSTYDALGIYDADVELNPIACPFEPQTFDIDTELEGVEFLDSVGTVIFNPDHSRLTLVTHLSRSVTGLEMDASHPVTLALPEGFHLDLMSGSGATKWDAEHATLIFSRLDDLLNGTYEFAVKDICVAKAVKDGELKLDGTMRLSAADDQLLLTGGRTTLNALMDNLGERTLDVCVNPTTLEVADVDVRTAQITETLNDTTSLNIDLPVGDLIEKAFAIYPKKPVDMTLALVVKGMEGLDVTAQLALAIAYPSFLCLESDAKDITFDDDGTMHMDITFNPSAGNISRTLRLTHLDFTKMPAGCLETVEVDGERHLRLDSPLVFDGTYSLGNTQLSLSDLSDEYGLHTEVSFADIELQMFQGIINYAIDPIETDIQLNEDESLDALFNSGNSLVLSDPELMVELTNPVGVPVDVSLQLQGFDASGVSIASSTIDVSGVTIAGGRYQEATRCVEPVTTKLLFVAKEKMETDGASVVVVPELANLLKVVPASVKVSLKPIINRTMTHYIDIARPLEIKGQYSVAIPMKFDELHVNYQTEKDAIKLSLGDVAESLTNAALRLSGNVVQTIPIGIELSLLPFDAEGQPVEDMQISTVKLAAGDGSAVTDKGKAQPVAFEVSATSEALARLASLQVSAKAEADHTEGGIALRPEQGILLKDLVLSVEAGVEINLNDND